MKLLVGIAIFCSGCASWDWRSREEIVRDHTHHTYAESPAGKFMAEKEKDPEYRAMKKRMDKAISDDVVIIEQIGPNTFQAR
jgi:hypothetical protein